MFKRYFNTALKNISILLALTLTLTSVFGCIASAEAEGTENSYIGTEADGYTGPGNIYDTPTPNEKFMNFDFEQGYKYWQKGDGSSEIITEDNGNHVLYVKCDAEAEDSKTNKTFLYSYPITVKNVVKGGEFALSVDVKTQNNASAGGDGSRITFQLRTTIADSNLDSGNYTRWSVKSNSNDYVTYSLNYKVPELADGTDEYNLYLVISHWDVQADMYIDNIKVGYQSDENFVYSNYDNSTKRESYYPSITDGVDTLVGGRVSNKLELYELSEAGFFGGYNTIQDKGTYLRLVNKNIVNGDFSKGLTGWAICNQWSTAYFPKDVGSVVDIDGAKAFLLNTAAMSTNTGLTQTVELDGVKKDDIVTFYFEYKFADEGNTADSNIYAKLGKIDSEQIDHGNNTYYQLQSTYSGTNKNGTYTDIGNGWTAATNIGSNLTYKVLKDNPKVTVDIFASKKTAVYIRNIKILVRENLSATGTAYAYSYYGAADDGKYYNADGRTEVSYYGTSTDGITTTGSNNSMFSYKLNSADIFDFKTNGLKYWGAAIQDGGAYGDGTKASDCATVNEDGSVTLKRVSKNAMGISSVYFKLPESVTKNGTNYAVWVDYVRIDGDSNSTDTNNYLYARMSTVKNNIGTQDLSSGRESGTLTFNAPAQELSGKKYGLVTLSIPGTKFNYTVSNFHLGYVDKGGMEKTLYVYEDGTPRDGDMGDANADGEVNILDLVRMKKRSSDNTAKIYFAAADMDGDDAIGATDIASLKKELLK